jgi:hypothetical protein
MVGLGGLARVVTSEESRGGVVHAMSPRVGSRDWGGARAGCTYQGRHTRGRGPGGARWWRAKIVIVTNYAFDFPTSTSSILV